MESGILDFGIWNTAPEIRNPLKVESGIQVPLTKNTEFTARNILARIQDCLGFIYKGWMIFLKRSDPSGCKRWLTLLPCLQRRRSLQAGHPTGNFEKKTQNNNKAWLKLPEAISSILGNCWEKFICSTLPARLMEEFSASKVHLQHSTWLTDRRMSRHY